MLEKWYVVHTKPRSEEKVCSQLKGKGLEIFAPKMKVTNERRAARAAVVEPVFPGYVFVRVELNPNSWYGLRWTPGVRRILGVNGAPSPVPDEVIEILKERMEKRGFIKPKARFHRGDKVRVKDGLFWGLVGVIEEARSGRERVKVLMDILHRSTRVEIHAAELEMVPNI